MTYDDAVGQAPVDTDRPGRIPMAAERMNVRVIPRLDIKGPNLVKGIHLEGLRVLGRPEYFARHYCENGADELMYQDVVASLFERNSLHEIISRTAREIFIPLAVGGGLRSIQDVRGVLRAGADKVSLNTAAIRRPELIREAALSFGSSTIVISIEAIMEEDGRYLAYVDNGREHTGLDVLEWAQRAEHLGAGEILLTSVDREGTGTGFDLELIRMVSRGVSIPVIAHGGAGSAEDCFDAFDRGSADAISVASILHYDCIQASDARDHDDAEGNVVFLKSGQVFKKIHPVKLPDIKALLTEKGVPCRHA